MKHILCCFLLMIAAVSGAAQQNGFSSDSALATLQFLAGDIGPRPMGSPAEQRALAYAASRFHEYGCQESYVMPMATADGVNTQSGIAVGVLKGTSGRIIIIGGHIDSAGPEIPGADDDGSGAACVIELARVLGSRPHQSTYVFCCWGGEEEGLRGSTHFAKNFPLIDSVALMLQIDMADGSGHLEIDPDGGYQVSAPPWLVDAAYDIYYRQLHYTNMIYPSQSATLNSSGSGATGSDHMPFLDRGIPAIDFTSDVEYPIHTPLDNLQRFTPSGLKRSGDLVLGLAERFDGGVPSRSTDKYWLMQVGTQPYFFSHPVLTAFVILAFVIALAGVLVAWRRRTKPAPETHIRWSGLKLLLVTFIVQACVWSAAIPVSFLTGYRFPWVNNWTGYVVLGIVGGLMGFWVGLWILRRLRTGSEEAPYLIRSVVLLALMTAALSLWSIEMGLYPGAALLLVGLMGFTRRPWLRVLLLALAVVIMWKLVFFEYLGFLQHGFTMVAFDALWKDLLYHSAFIVVFTLLSLPFVYAGAALYRGAQPDLFGLKEYMAWRGIAVAGALFIVLAVVLSHQKVYDDRWQTAVRVQESVRLGADSGTVVIAGGEFLSGLSVSHGGKDTVLQGRVNVLTLHPAITLTPSWCRIDTLQDWKGGPDSSASISRRVAIHSEVRPYMVTVTYRSKDPFQATSHWSQGRRGVLNPDTNRSKSFTWYSFPDTLLEVPVELTLKPGQEVKENVEVVYDTLAYPVELKRPLTYFTKRMMLTREGTIRNDGHR